MYAQMVDTKTMKIEYISRDGRYYARITYSDGTVRIIEA